MMKTVAEIKISDYSGVATDSRHVKPGYIFVCVQGFAQDGHNFAQEAVDKGATLVVANKNLQVAVPLILCESGREAAVYLSDKFYHHPSAKLRLVGITGTNGKSSVCFLAHKLLSKLGYKVGAIGTGKYLIGDKEFASQRTTPDVVELRFILAKMVSAKVDFVLMEVSSHAIALHRVDRLKFDLACFTNLSQDHLDFHKSMDDYAKLKLGFVQEVVAKGGTALVNADDQFGKTLVGERVKRVSQSEQSADYYFVKKAVSLAGCEFYLNDQKCFSPLLGEVNLFNSAFILSLLDMLLGKIFAQELQWLKPLEGRYNLLHNKVLVDYAHSPDSLEKVLRFAKKQNRRRVITLFGCGGDRDKLKRAIMGKLAVKYSDVVILCEDNSRREKVTDIIADILGDLPLEKIVIFRSRKRAIDYGLSLAGKQDLLLVLGRGAEPILDRGFQKLPFSDLDYLQKPATVSFAKAFDPLWVEKVLSARFDTDFPQEFVFEHISTDSRSLKPNSLFLALPGKRFDSYQFLPEVIKQPGCCAVVGKDCPQKSAKFLVVEDCLTAYGTLARAYLSQFHLKKIGITGSLGKTTTKEMLYNLLIQDGLTLKTKENENNQVGVPKTIFELRAEHKYLLIEMGSDHSGEIEALAKIVCPDIGIITNIDKSHLASFGTRQGVYEEKKNLFSYSQVKLTLDKDFFDNGLEYSFQRDAGDLLVTVDGLSFNIGNQPDFRSQSAALAIKAALLLGIDSQAIQRGLRLPLQLSDRLECKSIGGVNFIFDSYNANPSSMQAALEFWQNYKKGQNHFAILGQMLELGNSAISHHQAVAKFIKSGVVYGVGELAKNYDPDFFYADVEELRQNLPRFQKGDVVLIKGSNGVGLSCLRKIFINKLEG